MAAPVIATKSSTVQNSFETSTTLTAPTGIADGDVLLIVVNTDSNATAFSLPTGFIRITPADGDKGPSNTCTRYIIYKIASSESGDYTVTWTGAVKNVSYMYRITGAFSGDEIQDPDNANSGATDPMIALDFLTDSADVLAFAFHTNDNIQSTNSVGGTGWTNEDYNEVGTGGGSMTGAVSIKTIGAPTQTLDCTYPISSLPNWTGRQIAIRSLAPTVSITHDTDSILKAIDNELTHTTDSRVVIGVTLTHTTDSVLGERDPGISVTHDTDSVLKKLDITISHTTDSVLNVVLTVTHTTDSLVVANVEETHDTDSVLKKLDNELTHTTDSIVYETQTETHDTDSVLKAIDTLVTHDTDSVLKALDQEISHTTDSALREIDNILVHTTDSILKTIQSLTHTTDSHIVLPTIQTRIHTTDSILKKLDNIVSHTTDSLLTNIRGKRVITDLCVDETSTKELCVIDESEVDLCA